MILGFFKEESVPGPTRSRSQVQISVSSQRTVSPAPISESGFSGLSEINTATGKEAGKTSTPVDGILARLWRELPGLGELQHLQLRDVQGLDRGTCIRFVVKALDCSYLQTVDIRLFWNPCMGSCPAAGGSPWICPNETG